MGKEVLVVKVECVVRPDPWRLKTHMENFSKSAKGNREAIQVFGFLLCFIFEKRRGLL